MRIALLWSIVASLILPAPLTARTLSAVVRAPVIGASLAPLTIARPAMPMEAVRPIAALGVPALVGPRVPVAAVSQARALGAALARAAEKNDEPLELNRAYDLSKSESESPVVISGHALARHPTFLSRASSRLMAAALAVPAASQTAFVSNSPMTWLLGWIAFIGTIGLVLYVARRVERSYPYQHYVERKRWEKENDLPWSRATQEDREAVAQRAAKASAVIRESESVKQEVRKDEGESRDQGEPKKGPQGDKYDQLGKARYTRSVPDVRFSDIGGLQDAKEALEGLVDYLKNKPLYREFGIKDGEGPKGTILMGPPGTGKSLIAQAVAGEAGLPYYGVSGTDFAEMLVGVGTSRIHDLFKQARSHPEGAIIFIDEIDALGTTRGGFANHEDDKTLNTLLVELDGAIKDGVHVIAATNFIDKLDKALLRGGRLENHIPIKAPDVKGREEIFAIRTRGVPLAPDVDLAVLARRTFMMTGADIKQIVNDAAMSAGRRWRAAQPKPVAPSARTKPTASAAKPAAPAAKDPTKIVTMDDFNLAIEGKYLGKKVKTEMLDSEKRVIAYHESGHALVSHFLEHADPVTAVTIVPHGLNALGVTLMLPEKELMLRSREQLVDRLAVAMGGRAGEELMTGQKFNGIAGDSEGATAIARDMVMRFGMDDEMGYVLHGQNYNELASEKTKSLVDAKVRGLLAEGMERARRVLQDHRDLLVRVSDELMRRETIYAEEFQKIVGQPKARPGGESAGVAAQRR
ncbi:MAG: AAA family ATPase [Elusimicrobiota bacterium]